MFIINKNIKYTLSRLMNYLDHNEFVSKAVLREINNTVINYMDSEYSYVDCDEDLEDLENAEVTQQLVDEVAVNLIDLANDVKDEYDFSKIDEKTFPIESLWNMVESSFNDYRDIMIEQITDKLERASYIDDYYSELEEF